MVNTVNRSYSVT